ncbi:hypothetical protein [Parazoarcus communis]|uniref:Uncharacterized protein n=1 Tax=Parazoarcus communis SWub3 = DSM 12120 TaxID=1121029 RepID=A0A323UY32_9RHOO|nr:hypothetical protein [Parazoarcus communis]NMG70345.1 hypothetical protein [Parazoarcus communis SWub3 = DSM 12120]PZA16116.1 hypothetical protein DNK49_13990 [Azoarcus communis] [Parazoarcus communis SWub3 = DSM 12120]
MKNDEVSPTTVADLEKRLHSILGMTTALQVITLTLINTHPNPNEIANQLEHLTELGVARMLPSGCPDAVVQAYQDAIASACACANERRTQLG